MDVAIRKTCFLKADRLFGHFLFLWKMKRVRPGRKPPRPDKSEGQGMLRQQADSISEHYECPIIKEGKYYP